MADKHKILIVEDDKYIINFISMSLKKEDYDYVIAKTCGEANALFYANRPDMIILDLGLPDGDGIEIIKSVREISKIPIIVVSARQEEEEKIQALDLGADDYIVKPFSPGELVARVQAHIATYQRLKAPQERQQEITAGAIRICPKSHRVFVREQEVALKNKEYELLLFLVTNADTVFDRETLYERIWGMDAMGDNATVAVHINRLREKLEDDPSHPKYIETIWGAGYRFHA